MHITPQCNQMCNEVQACTSLRIILALVHVYACLHMHVLTKISVIYSTYHVVTSFVHLCPVLNVELVDAFNWVEFNPSTLARRIKRTFD